MIRLATLADLPEILRVYAAARAFMAANGNPSQWGSSFPPESLLREHLAEGVLYVVLVEEEIHGAFALMFGEDPLFAQLLEGAWLNPSPYATIHRLASDGQHHGIFQEILRFSAAQSAHLRIDTHPENRVMQHLIEQSGFRYCGIIPKEDGSIRRCYERW